MLEKNRYLLKALYDASDLNPPGRNNNKPICLKNLIYLYEIVL